MMHGQQDSTFPFAEKSTSHWHFGSPLSLATTADEDSLTGSPKQRWADLSDEDDEPFMLEPSPSAYRQEEVQETALGSTFGCGAQTLETNKQYASNEALSKWGGTGQDGKSKPFEKEQPVFVGSDAHANFGRFRDGKHSRPTGCPRGAESTLMLPPSSQSHASIGNSASDTEQAESDASQHATSHDIFIVTVSGIPPKLCNDTCLDAILWVAGVHHSALGSHSKKSGHVTMNFDTYEAAVACYNHFKACAWSPGKLKVDVVLPGSQQTRGDNRQPTKDPKTFADINHRPVKHTRGSLAQQM